jgi:hypothetical protein
MLRLKDLVVPATVVGLLACSGGGEKDLLNRFFMACRTGDNATIASVSQVSFPDAEGCEGWDLIEVSEEVTEPFRLTELRKQATDAKAERDIQFEKGKYFLEDNYNEIEKIQQRLDKNPDATFSGKLAEVQEEWQSIIENRKTLERTVGELNRELEKDVKLARMSLLADLPVQGLEGTVHKKEVKVTVTTGGQDKPYTFILQRYRLTNPETNVSPSARWIIVDIQEG